jgi:ubiquinone biosynthesis protein Coq4
VLYEKRWEQNITDFRREMNIEEPLWNFTTF